MHLGVPRKGRTIRTARSGSFLCTRRDVTVGGGAAVLLTLGIEGGTRELSASGKPVNVVTRDPRDLTENASLHVVIRT